MVQQPFRERQKQHGQSLVEFALALPVLLLIVAGVLEVGNVLAEYNRVQHAAREGARFGAEGGTDEGVETIVLQAASESLSTDEADISIWVIRPVIDTNNSSDPTVWSWDEWVSKHEYGTYDINPLGEATVLEDIAATSAYTQAFTLDTERFVVVVVRYEVETLLNLSFFRVPGEAGGRVPVWAYTVLRQEIEQTAVAQAAGGCSAYPIAFDQTELTGLSEGDTFTLSLADPAGAAGKFAFLSWRSSHALNTHLNAAMTAPGNSLSATEGFFEWGDIPNDIQMHRGDNVLSNPGVVADANAAISNHITNARAMRVVLFGAAPSAADPALGGYVEYTITGFAIVRIDSVSGNDITFEFIRTDGSCGFAS